MQEAKGQCIKEGRDIYMLLLYAKIRLVSERNVTPVSESHTHNRKEEPLSLSLSLSHTHTHTHTQTHAHALSIGIRQRQLWIKRKATGCLGILGFMQMGNGIVAQRQAL
ncbi:hypothetical protein GOP47_0018249 [Adiantum capillus-veneris]|uniref:Uncharacterized protein n=1 Tax=Adiantum capillus-veneris TaxID=13818 RepID=A0A9D4ZCL0_ADICA|nr:hypothetical protein GOP47_0018249 [Adiantum capillus-veneris]